MAKLENSALIDIFSFDFHNVGNECVDTGSSDSVHGLLGNNASILLSDVLADSKLWHLLWREFDEHSPQIHDFALDDDSNIATPDARFDL